MLEAQTHLINTYADFQRLVNYAHDVKSEYITIDVETNSENERKALLYGIGICFNDKRAFYLQWRDQKGVETFNKFESGIITSWLLEICQKKKLLNHNIIYDVLVLQYNLGINLTPFIYSDTILLKHTIDEEEPFALKELAVITLGPWADKAQKALKDSVIANGGKWTEKQKDMYLADTAILGEYCMWDVLLTYKLFKIYHQKVVDEGLHDLFYTEEIMPLYRECTIPMKRSGFTIDLPYFKQLKREVEQTLITLEDEVITEIGSEVAPFVDKLLDKKAPVKDGGNFPKFLANVMGIPLPVNPKGKVTLSAKALEAQTKHTPEFKEFYEWIAGKGPLSANPTDIRKARELMFINTLNNAAQKKGKKVRYSFNLNSSTHLGYYFFDLKKLEAKGVTKSGKKQVDAKFIDEVKVGDPQAQKIIDFKKLQKLLGTYINGILSRQIDGLIYASMLQFGTTSGRYSCRNPNLQNLPRIKDEEAGLSELVLKYVNSIRKGFIAPPGYKIVNADFSQLEPCCFATMSGDQKLQDVFRKGEDLYSRIAIDVFKMHHLSASKKDPNFLKKVSPEFRGKAKIFTLAVPYGAEESRIGQAMSCDRKEASSIIKAYLNAYPELKKYMTACNWSVKKNGYVKTKFGRIRHLPLAKILFDKYGNDLLDWRWAKHRNLLDERRKFKNYLNNAKNFPIQGLAAHIVNRSMIAIAREFIAQEIDGYIALQVHDEITCIVREDQAELAKAILKKCMETTTTVDVPLVAEPLIAQNWAEAK